jgi:opacity protein-like surface antigen
LLFEEKKMKEKTCNRLLFDCLILSVLLVFATSSFCSAEEWSRAEKIEVYPAFIYMGSDTAHFTLGGVQREDQYDSTNTYGFGLGYNFDDHFNLNTDFVWGSVDNRWNMPVSTIVEEPYVFLWNVNLHYNVFKGRLTPVLGGGIGYARYEGDGWIEKNVSYNVGAGGRWDINDNLFVMGMYGWLWTEYHNADDSFQFDVITIHAGFMF